MSRPLLRNEEATAGSFHRQLNGRTVGEVATYQCSREGQRERSVIHVLVREQSHRRRDGRTLQILCGWRDRAR